MLRYIIRRTLYIIPIVFGVALITFLLFHIAGGNPAEVLAGKHATEEVIKDIEHQLGFDKPLFVNGEALKKGNLKAAFDSQFVFYLKQIVTLNFGRSYSTKQKVSTMLLDGLGPSLSLMVPAFIFGSLLGICIALFCAFYRNSFIDKSLVILSITGMSVSMLAYIIGGQYILAFKLKLFPIHGYARGFAGLKYLVLPGLIWVISGLGSNIRFFRTVMLDETKQDYVRTAFAKGLNKKAVLFKHILKNSLIPIITVLVIALPFLYTGSLLLERFFGIPGLGDMFINAFLSSDFPVMKALVFIGSVLYVFANLLSDICYAWVDPRVRLR
ncbi:MAG: ABC transporter permease [Nitrospirae bacterium]|nr:ABC transporter permease [Nitrospirota bacterium]